MTGVLTGATFTEPVTVLHGDNVDLLQTLPDGCVDAVITDPPYGLSAPPDPARMLADWVGGADHQHRAGGGFMGAEWDAFVPGPRVWQEALRVARPGAWACVFASSRTVDLMTVSLRIAGWQIVTVEHWGFASALPKSMNVAHQLARADGPASTMGDGAEPGDVADRWTGWGTNLKVAHEPIVIARKPVTPGGAPVDAPDPGPTGAVPVQFTAKAPTGERARVFIPSCQCLGNPHDPVQDPSVVTSSVACACFQCGQPWSVYLMPTVKPIEVMSMLVRRYDPSGGVVLDPFSGSGSTGVAAVQEQRPVILMERDPVHVALTWSRLSSPVQVALFG